MATLDAEKKFLAMLKGPSRPPVVFIHGVETYLVDGMMSKIRKQFRGEAETLEGSTTTGPEVLERLQTTDLFGPQGPRLVQVRSAGQMKEMDVIAAAFEKAKGTNPWEPALLVLTAETLDGRRSFFKLLKKQNLTFECGKPALSDVPLFLKEMAEEEGLTLSADALALLTVVGSESLSQARQELAKIAIYKGDSAGAVTREEVQMLGVSTIRFEMAELVKAVVENRRARSLLLASRLVRVSEDALGFVGFLTWCLKNPEKFSWSRRPESQRLVELSESALDLDTRLKSTGLDAPGLVDAFIVEMT